MRLKLSCVWKLTGFKNSKHESIAKSGWNMWELTSYVIKKNIFIKGLKSKLNTNYTKDDRFEWVKFNIDCLGH